MTNQNRPVWSQHAEERRDAFLHSRFRFLANMPLLTSLFALGLVVSEIGFYLDVAVRTQRHHLLVVTMLFACLFMVIRHGLFYQKKRLGIWVFDGLFVIGCFATILALLGWAKGDFFHSGSWLFGFFLLAFLRELSTLNIIFKRSSINPAFLFLLSFLGVILMGTAFLQFPKATVGGIRFVDALFTSTSAVCVTGLVIADTSAFFTPIGQVIILFLIQIGGLGIMTFTSYFSYYFRGESSYENQLMIQAMTGTDKIAEVFGALKHVLILTFTIETLGALVLFLGLSGNPMTDFWDKLYFSIFHAISAFCNAGFSTVQNGLCHPAFMHEYDIQLTLGGLIILGGLGFPILYNFWTWAKRLIVERFILKTRKHAVRVINLSTRIIAITTLSLLVFGTVCYYLMESTHVLAAYDGYGKWVASFFASVTARTAGFNGIDYAQLTLPAIVLSYFLMWVGASPASTGGGIKTSVFAISLLNSISIAKGRGRIEAFGREITDISVKRAYSQVFLSVLAIGFAVTLITVFDSSVPLRSVIFECISAFSTVGLSMGITPQLTDSSKLVLVLTMFVGRVSLLTLMAALVKQVKFKKYQYPSEDILIN